MTDSRRGGKPTELRDFSGGLCCDLPSHMISVNELSDVQNFDVDSPGKLISRKGYTHLAEAGIALAPVRGIYEHVERDGRKHVVAACNGRLWRLNERNRTWSEIYRESNPVTWGDNLLTNGDFTTDTTGWTLTNGGTNTSIVRDSGTASLLIQTTAPAELIGNTGFEVGVDAYPYWWVATDGEIGGTARRITTSPHSGTYCGQVRSGSHDSSLFTSPYVVLKANDVTTMVAWGRTYSGEAGLATLVFYTAGGVVTGWDSLTSSMLATWQQASDVMTTAPANTVQAKVSLTQHVWDDISLKARPRLADTALSPAATIVPANRRKVSFKIKRSSSVAYPNMTFKVHAKYYSDAGATTLIYPTVELTEPTTTPTDTTITVEQAGGVAPATAIRMRLYLEASGYFDAYDAAAAGHGWYIDNIEIREKDDSGAVITPLIVNERVSPTFVSFMGNLYIFGYDRNLKVTQAKAVEMLPSYPTAATFAAVYQNRLFLAGDPENPSRLYFTSYTAGGGATPDVISPFDFIDFDPDDGDKITGIAPCGAGVVVFKARSTFMLTGSNEYDWFVRKVSSAVGCASHRSIIVYQGNVIFLDPVNPGVFMFDGSVNFTMLSRKIDPLIARIVYPERSCAVIRDERYYLFCDDRDSVHPYNETVYVYSLKTGAWTRYSNIAAGSVCKRANGALIFGSAADDGKTYKLFEGYTDDGADIEAYMVTGDLQFRGGADESRIRKVTVLADSGKADEEIVISYASDRNYIMTDAAAMSMEASGTNRFEIGEWDTAVWEEAQMLRHPFVPAAGSANQFRVKLSHTDSERITLYGIDVLERERRVRS